MSHSQFHSTNLFILRHAWLNLWDKHMTTGRINQVTTFPFPPSYSPPLRWLSRVSRSSSTSQNNQTRLQPLQSVRPHKHQRYWLDMEPAIESPWIRSHKLQMCQPLLSLNNKITLSSLYNRAWQSTGKTTSNRPHGMMLSHGGSSTF